MLRNLPNGRIQSISIATGQRCLTLLTLNPYLQAIGHAILSPWIFGCHSLWCALVEGFYPRWLVSSSAFDQTPIYRVILVTNVSVSLRFHVTTLHCIGKKLARTTSEGKGMERKTERYREKERDGTRRRNLSTVLFLPDTLRTVSKMLRFWSIFNLSVIIYCKPQR